MSQSHVVGTIEKILMIIGNIYSAAHIGSLSHSATNKIEKKITTTKIITIIHLWKKSLMCPFTFTPPYITYFFHCLPGSRDSG